MTPAQESASARPHVPLFKHCNWIFPRHRDDRQICVQLTALTRYRRAHRMPATCRPEKAARFVFRGWLLLRSRQCAHRGRLQPSVIAMTNSATSHLLPVFARVDLGFERGEGAWLIATNGERYLDFTSGVAVNALGHAHPHLVAALQEQATKLWHMSNLFKSPDGERLAARLCEQSFADFVFFCQFRRRGDGMRDQARAPISRSPRAIPSAIASSPSKARSTAARWRRWPRPARRNISKALGRRWTASTRCRIGDLEAVKKAIGPHTAGILIEPVQGEGGVRARAACVLQGVAPALRRATACCWSSTRCRPAWAAPAICSPTSASASRPT